MGIIKLGESLTSRLFWKSPNPWVSIDSKSSLFTVFTNLAILKVSPLFSVIHVSIKEGISEGS